MEGSADPTTLIDLPGQMLDKVVEVLAKVGIDLPALMLQIFLLVLVLLALFAVTRPWFPDWRNTKPLPLLTAAAMALIAVGIVFGIVSQTRLPDRLVGRVTGSELGGVRVDLLDFRGEAVSTGGTVDTQTGEFMAYYSPTWNGRARTLKITSPACKPHQHPIPRSRLAVGAESTWEFPCDQS